MAFVVAVFVFAAGFYCRCLVPAVFKERFLPLGDYGSVVFDTATLPLSEAVAYSTM